jgi:hypothetical protein
MKVQGTLVKDATAKHMIHGCHAATLPRNLIPTQLIPALSASSISTPLVDVSLVNVVLVIVSFQVQRKWEPYSSTTRRDPHRDFIIIIIIAIVIAIVSIVNLNALIAHNELIVVVVTMNMAISRSNQ